MRQHMDRRFDKLHKDAKTRFTSAGLIVRVILLLLLLAGGKWFCDSMTEESIKYHQEQNERSY